MYNVMHQLKISSYLKFVWFTCKKNKIYKYKHNQIKNKPGHMFNI